MMNTADLQLLRPFYRFDWVNNALSEMFAVKGFTDAERYLETHATKAEMVRTFEKLGMAGKTLKDILAFDPDDLINEAVEKLNQTFPFEATWMEYGSPCDEIEENGCLLIYPGRMGQNAWTFDDLEQIFACTGYTEKEFSFEYFLIMIGDQGFAEYFADMAEHLDWPFSEYPHIEFNSDELPKIRRRLYRAGMKPFWQAMVTTYNLINNIFYSFMMPWDGGDGDDPYSFTVGDIRLLMREWKQAEPYNKGRLEADRLVQEHPSLIADFMKVAFRWTPSNNEEVDGDDQAEYEGENEYEND